jgi:hypothetical protein
LIDDEQNRDAYEPQVQLKIRTEWVENDDMVRRDVQGAAAGSSAENAT